MQQLIRPEELPRWVPGEVLRSSEGLGWRGVGLRAYRYQGSDVAVPPLADFMVVSYRRGTTHMERRFEGRWTRTECHPGDVSLLTRSQQSHWHWTNQIDVTHTYLSEDLVAKVAADVLDRAIVDVRLHDLLKARDPVITAIVDGIYREASDDAIGGALYVEALSTQLAVHLLRGYVSVSYRDQSGNSCLPAATCRRLVEFIDSHLEQSMTLDELARFAGMGVWSFGKRFRESFGKAPHTYIIDLRVARARKFLAQGTLPLKAIAAACGFADQAHMTRVLRARLGTTPAALRR